MRHSSNRAMPVPTGLPPSGSGWGGAGTAGRVAAGERGDAMPDEPWRAPLSGDVAQAINPFTWWIRGSQQAGFININASRTDNPELEKRIVEDVASYGRQLGRIIDALDVLAARLPADDLTPDERDAMRAFGDLAERIAAVKERARPTRLTRAGVERLIDEVHALKRRDRARYDELAGRLREAFPRE